MRRFNITVNGVSYEVEVEEILGAGPSNVVSTPAAKPAAPAPELAPTAKPAPAQAAKPAPAAIVPEDAITIEAPMPGDIWKVEVVEGQEVKAGDTLLILEAMKMENEILAPVDGIVASVHVAKGAVVNSGDVLVSLKQ